MSQVGYDTIASPSEFARSKYFYALLGGFFGADKHFYFERNYYPAYEILLITSGKGWFRHGEHWLGLVEGDCLLHDMRYPHAYKGDPIQPFQMKYLIFDGHLLEKMWADFFSSPVTIHRLDSQHAVVETMEAVIQTIQANDDMDDMDDMEMRISLLIYQLLLQFVHQSNKGQHPIGVAKPDPVIAAQKYMNEHYLAITEMEAVAKNVNLSYYHFIRQFKRYCGCTPKEYILLKRVNHAKRLILLTNHTVTEIASMSGFNNYNSFLHSFHRIEKCSPTDYRKNWKLY